MQLTRLTRARSYKLLVVASTFLFNLSITTKPAISTENSVTQQAFRITLKNVDSSLGANDIGRANREIRDYLSSPQYRELSKLEEAAFFKSLSNVFDERHRPSDAKDAEKEALKRISSLDVSCAASEFDNNKDFASVLSDLDSGKTSVMEVKPKVNEATGSIDIVGTLASPSDSAPIKNKLRELSILTPEKILALRAHAVTTTKDGLLCPDGIIGSSPEQIDAIFKHIESEQKALNSSGKKLNDVVIYAHGGLTSEAEALKVAATQLPLWKERNVYPVFLLWKSGLEEMIADSTGMRFLDQAQPNGKSLTALAQLPSLEIPLAPELNDSLVESFARGPIRNLWLEMKIKSLASFNKPLVGQIDWSKPLDISKANGGGALFLSRLNDFCKKNSSIRVHLIGHSAGSIVLAAVIDNMLSKGLPVKSVHLLAPAITVLQFRSTYLPHMYSQRLKNLCIYDLSDEFEKKDKITAGLLKYNKSLLYLVSRSLEWNGGTSRSEYVPLLGMQRFFEEPAWEGTPKSLRQELLDNHVTLISSPPPKTNSAKCNADSHGGFGSEPATLTNIMNTISALKD